MHSLREWQIRWGVPDAAIAELIPSVTAVLDDASSEQDTQARLRVKASQCGGALWRNNSGATQDDTGRWVRYGLGNDSKKLNESWKSSDLIGITPMTWQGHTFGVFTAVEVKHPGWKKPESDRDRAQLAFHMTVRRLGGIAGFVTHVDQYEGLMTCR